jgi:hypothetical protein
LQGKVLRKGLLLHVFQQRNRALSEWIGVLPERVDFGSGQGRSAFENTGVA